VSHAEPDRRLAASVHRVITLYILQIAMPDDKRGREKQSRDADNRQRQRDIAAALERSDETEPPVDTDELETLTPELDTVAFPATGSEVVEAVGTREVDAAGGTKRIADLVPETGEETFDSPDDVHVRLQRPEIAASMKRIVEASDRLRNARLGYSQREAYEKTLRALKAVDADDDDEGVEVVTEWIVERIRDDETFPGSRAVRRRAAKFCRENGYEIRNDEWLGV